MRIAALVLAAGGSSRLGEPKQLLANSSGETLVHRAARSALDAGTHPVMVIVGAHALGVRDALCDLEVQIIENVNWPEGLASSIRCGVQTLDSNADLQEIRALLLLTCDMPAVGAAHLRALVSVFESNGRRVASAYNGTCGVPAIFPRAEFDALLQLRGDAGAKALLAREDTHRVALPGGGLDIDSVSDVARWRGIDTSLGSESE